MIPAWIVEVRGDGTHLARGRYEFLALPAVGDRVTLVKEKDKRDVFGVLLLEHLPKLATGPGSAAAPSATVYVQWIGEDDGVGPFFN